MKLPKTYDPHQYEPDIYALWESSGAFAPSGEGKPYGIVMPPPNANASLHLGTAFMTVIEDILIRYHRMIGDRTIYIPGADHAGFETWVVYERYLEKQGKSRFDFSRDDLYKQVWDFVAENRTLMETQMRELGASCDWSKLVFTLDDNVVKIAYDTFRRMWDDKLIYRGERIVNYCTVHGTSFSDIEVDFKDKKSKLWHIRYPVVEGEGEVVVATTRPETMFGDVAVAVHPDDKRHKDLIGKHVTLPLVNKAIPVISDEMVNVDFGTGAVKITPAHDPNDFEVGERHHLPRVTVIDFEGKLNEEAPLAYQGMSAEEARAKVAEDLKNDGYLLAEEDYQHSVGHCYKCGTVLQPLLKDQWFIRVKSLADRAAKELEKKSITFYPDNKRRVLINYLKNLKDWNISRQIPWGIPIPAFQNIDDPEDWIFDERVEQEEIKVDGKTYKRDPDTFDTWFSSGQWPYLTTTYHPSGELKDFFPISVMETAADILFAWVSKMVMFSLYREDKLPFKDVYLHGLVLAEDGQKMSKSRGNGVNPQDVIKEYGSDALRQSLVMGRAAGQNQPYSSSKVVTGRNFANKLWNMARYVEGVIGENPQSPVPNPQSNFDHWIVRELGQACQDIAKLIEDYRFAEAYESVYHVIWDKVADWYLEASKTALEPSVAAWVLETCLKLAHPFAPFVTETIWQTLGWREELLISSKWPEVAQYDEKKAGEFDNLMLIIGEAREILATLSTRNLALVTTDSQLVLDNQELLRRLIGCGYVNKVEQGSGIRLVSSHEQAWLDADADQVKQYRDSLEKKLQATEKEQAALEHRLANKSYVDNAPVELVEESRKQLEVKTTQAQHLRHQLKHLD